MDAEGSAGPARVHGLHAMRALGIVALCACAFNQEGNTHATKRGDTSHPAERGSPIAELRAACGEGDSTRAIRRRPYVQNVTSSSAVIGWVSTERTAQRVAITRPDGTPVGTFAARDERGQRWATLANLEPDTTYCYAIVGATARTGFRTAPLARDARVRFLAFGDSGAGGNDQRALRDQMMHVPYDLVIHTGDVAYDDGSLGQYETNVFGVYHELFRNRPFFPASGNHDYRTQQGEPFRDVFALPGSERWYSYDWGGVHFAALDTEADYATQARWLEHDLAATQQPWKIVYLHRPPYSSGAHGSDLRARKLFAPIFERFGVQLVLAGHDHDYERTKPQRGVHYIVTGGGGRGTYGVGDSSFTAFSENVIHFVYAEVTAHELVLHAIDASGTEFDSVVIPRSSS